jgi:hypothetical protein
MFVLYLDEFGHAGAWDPGNARFSHHPLFGLAGICVEDSRWRDLDRGFLRLKQSFYARELSREATLKGLRPERFEPKRLSSTRDRRFAVACLRLVGSCEGRVFAYGCAKRTGAASHSEVGLYTATVQGTLRGFEKYLKQFGRARGKGVVVLDRRSETQNRIVLESAQSHLFGSTVPRFERLIETPLLVPSEWYHGVQLADCVGRVVSAVSRFRALSDVRYRWAGTRFGPTLDLLTVRVDRWVSVYVKPV